MILSTTPTIEGYRIKEYRGVVFGEVITGVNFIKDFAASIRNFVGGRSSSYEEELTVARQNAMREMEDGTYRPRDRKLINKSFGRDVDRSKRNVNI